jgi:hypothetical protein
MEMMPHLTTFHQIQLGADFNLESCSQWDRRKLGAGGATTATSGSSSSSTAAGTGTGFSSSSSSTAAGGSSFSAHAPRGEQQADDGAMGGGVVVKSYDLVVGDGEEEEGVKEVLLRSLAAEQLEVLSKLKVGWGLGPAVCCVLVSAASGSVALCLL